MSAAAESAGRTPPSADSRRRLLQLLDHVAAVARRVTPTVRRITLAGLLSAAWIGYSIQQATGAGEVTFAVLLLVLMIPGLVTGWLWWILSDLEDLPAEAEKVLGQLRRMSAHDTPPDPAQEPRTEPAPRRGNLGSMFHIGGPLREAARLAWHVEGVHGPIVAVLVLANPLFLLVLGASLLSIALLAFSALLTALAVWIF